MTQADDSHGHDHGGGGGGPTLTTRRARAWLGGIVALFALGAVVGAGVLWPESERSVLAEELGFQGELVNATIASGEEGPCASTREEDGIRCQLITIDITSGPTKGESGTFELALDDAVIDLDRGDKIVVQYQRGNPPELTYFFQDFQRGRPLTLLLVVFAIAVVALGRWQGVRALIALGITGVVLVGFAFPSILDGNNPTAVALVTAVLIALVALYLTHGVTEMTTVALLGSFAALALTAALAVVFTRLALFTGFGTEDAFYLRFASGQIDIKGLILAGIIVGSLGVLDDVTVTQASAVWRLHETNPAMASRQLYGAAVRIGRDHIASTVNTLVLAYAGASLPLLLIFSQAGRGITTVATGELVAVEIVRTLVGSIGLIAAVPLTTGLAAVIVTRGSALSVLGRRPAHVAQGAPAPSPAVAEAEPEPAPKAPGVTWEQFGPDDDPTI